LVDWRREPLLGGYLFRRWKQLTQGFAPHHGVGFSGSSGRAGMIPAGWRP
jgi:hypothetical protein